MPKRILFLCTGNYYRSRFAEGLFNVLARREGLDYVAFSRALALELGGGNIGPIAPATLTALRERGAELPEPLPMPCQAREGDFVEADHVVALKEAEHRPLLERRFPDWSERVEYWHVHDLDQATPAQTLREIEILVSALIARLKHG